MARITYVKKAQQRYAQIPVFNVDGTPAFTAVMNTRTGQQKVTKAGKPVFMRVKADDKSQPLALLECEKCRNEIQIGSPYKHVTPKSGPYGGRKRIRCASCPDWQFWDLSNSLSARIAQIQHEAYERLEEIISDLDETDVESIASDIAGEVRGLAEEKREAAENIESGFNHPTAMSDELNEQADALEGWADDLEGIDVPEKPEEEECGECDGTGYLDPEETEECAECGNTGLVPPGEDTLDQWVEEARDALSELIDSSPL